MSGPDLHLWKRADGWIEIDTPLGPRRYRTNKEAEAFMSGARTGFEIIRRRLGGPLDEVDNRPIQPAPKGDED